MVTVEEFHKLRPLKVAEGHWIAPGVELVGCELRQLSGRPALLTTAQYRRKRLEQAEGALKAAEYAGRGGPAYTWDTGALGRPPRSAQGCLPRLRELVAVRGRALARAEAELAENPTEASLRFAAEAVERARRQQARDAADAVGLRSERPQPQPQPRERVDLTETRAATLAGGHPFL